MEVVDPETKARLNAHAVVVSRQPVPSGTNEGIAQSVGDFSWSWVCAGVERQPGAHRESNNLLDAGVPGLVAGRHKALQACTEDIIIYLDDDVRLRAGWAESIVEPFADPDIHFVGCRYLPDYEHEPPSWLKGLWQEAGDDFHILGHLSLLDGGEEARLYPP